VAVAVGAQGLEYAPAVTDVAFHTGLPDKLDYACRLLRKAWGQGARIVVTGAPAELDRLDEALWVFDQDEFIPHCRLRAGQAPAGRMRRTPIWLADDADADVGADVMVNLGPAFEPRFERYARAIELVALGVEEVQAGRQRWRCYAQAGTSPVNHPYRGAS
jgi:DNA polymerase-3 subunit chi